MKAAALGQGGKFVISEIPRPQPGPGEVLVKVEYCGICGSDIHMLAAGILPPGCIIGHEFSGSIAGLGQGVEGRGVEGRGVEGWKEDEQVVALPADPCGECLPCREGHTQICAGGLPRSYGLGYRPGAFAEYMLVKSDMLYRVPDGLDLRTAALTEPWAVAIHAVRMMAPRPGDVVLIMGAGPIGLFCIYALRAAGVKQVYVSEPDKFRADKAQAVGATAVIDPAAEQPSEVLQEKAGRAPDLVIDAVGGKSSTLEAVGLVKHRGRVLVLGVHMAAIPILPIFCFMKEVQINFSFAYNAQEFSDALSLLGHGAIDPEIIISDTLPLGRINEAFEMLHGSGHTKIIINCKES